MKITFENLTDRQKDIADLIGVEATVKLCEVYGGSALYIPKLIDLQKEKRNMTIRRACNGRNTADVAKEFGLSPRTVQLINAKA